MQREIAQFGDVPLVALSVDAPDVSRAMREERGYTFPVLADENRATILAYNIHDTIFNIAKPATFVLDAEGIIRWKHVGGNKQDRPPLAAILEEVAKASGESDREEE